jgi:cysteine-rich repeat protein
MSGQRLFLAAILMLGCGSTASFGAPPPLGGPVIIGGDDADDHGSSSGTQNFNGWLYTQKAFENIGPAVANPNKVAVCIGCNGGGASGAFESGFDLSTLPAAGWTRATLTATADIAAFFAGTGALHVGTAGIIYMPTDSSNVSGGITTAQVSVVNGAAAAIASFVASGGGLFTHDQSLIPGGFGWLTTLIPGLVRNDPSSCNDLNLDITASGQAAFPGLTNSDVDNATPWHSYFTGSFAGLDVLITGPCASGAEAVVLGGVTIINPNPDIDPKLAFNPIGGNHTVTATVVDSAGGAFPDILVTFEVIAGPNQGATGTATTDAQGKATFTYADQGGRGLDEIVASFVDGTSGETKSSQAALKFWDNDCNANSAPDGCDLSCGAYGGRCGQRYPTTCGTSQDVAPQDGVPDECLPGGCGDGQLDPGESCDDGNANDGDCCSSTCVFEASGRSCPDEGDACTLDTCDGAGVCRHAPQRDTLECLGVDHFRCYKARAEDRVRRLVTLTDEVGQDQLIVMRADAVCNPVDKNGEGILDPSAHLVCYTIAIKESPATFSRRQLTLENQFGLLSIPVTRPRTVCVPSTKSGVPSALLLDSFKCYKAARRKFTPRQLHLEGEFGPADVTMERATTICNPATDGSEPYFNQAGHLTCYKLRQPREQRIGDVTVTMQNEFGIQSLTTIRKPESLCVPSIGHTDGTTTTTTTTSTTTTTTTSTTTSTTTTTTTSSTASTSSTTTTTTTATLPASLEISKVGPPGAFPNQEFDFIITVSNAGPGVATGVVVRDALPTEGSLVSSSPAGSFVGPNPNDYEIPVPDIAAGAAATLRVRWKAPLSPTTVVNQASVSAQNAPLAGPAEARVTVGISSTCDPCGAVAGGTGLRNRDQGPIQISGIPAGASVGRAVLIWGILYTGSAPANTITFDGHVVTADVTATVSGNLCWGDTNTIGYAADVTRYVTGNGTYTVSDPVRGTTQIDANPRGVLPYTDGASLVVFYTGGGANNQVLSDFSYDTNTDADRAINRSFSNVNSLGGAASLILAGPDGQNDGGEVIRLTGGAGSVDLVNTWNGSDPQIGPQFSIGNLWDTDTYDVTSLLAVGTDTLTVSHVQTNDCIGIGAAVLQVAQGAVTTTTTTASTTTIAVTTTTQSSTTTTESSTTTTSTTTTTTTSTTTTTTTTTTTASTTTTTLAQNLLSIGEVVGNRGGGDVIVPVSLNSTSNLSLLRFDVTFDPQLCASLTTPGGITVTAVSSATRVVKAPEEQPVTCGDGVVQIAVLDLLGGTAVASGNGEILNINFGPLLPTGPTGAFTLGIVNLEARLGPSTVSLTSSGGSIDVN